ncbi:MAG: SGNH/GDSL hydrolase family protein [Mesorhizobium sp.]|nr:MAG: SGNH/GDSL hydrolase family protein [Mesorhizobium sp.]
MTATPYPLPRETRESAILVGNGTVGPYGPSLYKIFDILDVAVFARAAGEDVFSDVTDQVTVTKTTDAEYDTFSVTFDAAVPVSTEWQHQARRVAERSVAVTRAGTIDSLQLEKELSKQATTQSEMRRDVDRKLGFQPDYNGDTNLPPVEEGKALAWVNGQLGNSPIAPGDIASAVIATAADRVQTGLDRTQTGLDRTQTGLDRTQTGLDRTQTGLDRAQTAVDVVAGAQALAAAQAARDASLYGKGIFPTPAAAIGLGIVGHGAITPGAAGTNGTFALAFTGGTGSGAAGRFVVAGGVLTQIVITAPGSYTVAPTLDFSASAGLAGAAAAAILGTNVAVGEYFWAPVSSTELGLYSVAAGPAAVDTGIRDTSYLLSRGFTGKASVAATSSLFTGLAYIILSAPTTDKVIDSIDIACAAGTVVIYEAEYVSGTLGVDLVVKPVRARQYTAPVSGVNNIPGKGFKIRAGYYPVVHVNQGIWRLTAGGAGMSYVANTFNIGANSAAQVFVAGHQAQVGLNLIGDVAADNAAKTIEAIQTFEMGLPFAAMAADTAFSSTVWPAPEEPSPIDGYVTEAWAYGTNAGTLEIYVATKNADGTYTRTASFSQAVPAGICRVFPNLPIAKGQVRVFRHTGVVHRTLTTGGLRWFYLNAAPNVSTPAASVINGSNLMFGSKIEGVARGLATVTESRVTALEGGSNPWSGRKVAFLGTSITAGDSWVAAVAAELGMTATDLGVGGGHITSWNPGGPGGEIPAQIPNIPVDASLVILEGFVNDIWHSAPLGVYTDKAQTAAGTFYGACWSTFGLIKARAPNALIVCLCDWNTSTLGDGTQEEQDVNALGFSPWQYREAFERVADMAGLPFLKLSRMGFGYFTPEFYSDHIHENAAGNARIPTWVVPFIRLLRPIS